MTDRAAKRRRVLELRENALDLVTAYGRAEANVDYHGQLTRIRSYDERRLRIEYWAPRHPTGVDRRERRPTTYMLFVKWNGDKVLQVGWDGERVNLIRYEPGGWEDLVE